MITYNTGNLKLEERYNATCTIMNKHELRVKTVIENEQRFFRNVEYLRKMKGLSQQGLCKLISDEGFTVSYRSISVYGGWSKKKYSRRVSLYYLAAFADGLGYSIGDLLSRDYQSEESLKALA